MIQCKCGECSRLRTPECIPDKCLTRSERGEIQYRLYDYGLRLSPELCPSCGAEHPESLRRKGKDAAYERDRICRACGCRIVTEETITMWWVPG